MTHDISSIKLTMSSFTFEISSANTLDDSNYMTII
jgi:hypothetical protein